MHQGAELAALTCLVPVHQKHIQSELQPVLRWVFLDHLWSKNIVSTSDIFDKEWLNYFWYLNHLLKEHVKACYWHFMSFFTVITAFIYLLNEDKNALTSFTATDTLFLDHCQNVFFTVWLCYACLSLCLHIDVAVVGHSIWFNFWEKVFLFDWMLSLWYDKYCNAYSALCTNLCSYISSFMCSFFFFL